MKRLLSVCLLSALTVISVCAAKQRVTVHGVAPQGAETITVFDGGTGRPLGPALAVKDGQFTYNATVTDPTYVMFYHAESRALNYVILDSDNIQLDMKANQVKGSPLTEELFAVCDTLTTLFEQKDTTAAQRLEAVIARHPKDCLPITLINIYYVLLPFESIERIVESKAVFTRWDSFSKIQKAYDKSKFSNSLIGQKFIDAPLHTAIGKKVMLSEAITQGKYVLVDFWASWCGPCMGEMPYLIDSYQKYKDKGFEIVGVSLDRDRAAWIKAISSKGLSWPQYSDLDKFDNKIASTYQVSSIPWNFLCDPNGTIIAVSLRGEALAQKLKEVLE